MTALESARSELRKRGATGYIDAAAQAIVTAADAANIPAVIVAGRSRRPDVVRARWAAMATLRGQRLSASDIGRAFGVDHSTVLHGLKRHEQGRAA